MAKCEVTLAGGTTKYVVSGDSLYKVTVEKLPVEKVEKDLPYFEYPPKVKDSEVPKWYSEGISMMLNGTIS